MSIEKENVESTEAVNANYHYELEQQGQLVPYNQELFNMAPLLIHYLQVLQDGRIKPNKYLEKMTEGEGSCCEVRDSLDNLSDIAKVKKRLADIFSL